MYLMNTEKVKIRFATNIRPSSCAEYWTRRVAEFLAKLIAEFFIAQLLVGRVVISSSSLIFFKKSPSPKFMRRAPNFNLRV